MIRGPQVPGRTRSHAPARRRTGPPGWLRPHAEDLPADDDPPGEGLTVGVLALQGAFAEHATALRRLGADVHEVRRPEHLAGLDALVMPGGESTTMSKLLASSGLFDVLDTEIQQGFPVFGTCAGMILLANEVLDGRSDQCSFGALDVSVRRNGYGRQVDSFEANIDFADAKPSGPFRAVFIRAPLIDRVGENVELLATSEGMPVLVRQGSVLASSFHPELTADLRVHRYFIEHIVRTRTISPIMTIGGN
jgi:pyridoxal 5'-phosphate synthase pdxT subunit